MTEVRVLVGTDDFERSAAFYSDVLGFPVDEHWDDPDGRGTLFRITSGGVIEIVETPLTIPPSPRAGSLSRSSSTTSTRCTTASQQLVSTSSPRSATARGGIETSRSETRAGSASCSSLESERQQRRDR